MNTDPRAERLADLIRRLKNWEETAKTEQCTGNILPYINKGRAEGIKAVAEELERVCRNCWINFNV